MALVMSKYRAYGREIDQPTTNRFSQWLHLTFTAANTDVTLDFGNFTGTFWTAVTGTPAAGALAAIKDINARAGSFVSVAGKGLTGKAALGSNSPTYAAYLSNSAAGGGTTETYVVTGLAVGDVVQAVTPAVATANAAYIRAYGAVGANQLPVTYNTDPGAAGKVTVLVLKAATTPLAGQYVVAPDGTNPLIPDITLVSGDGSLAYDLLFQWELLAGTLPLTVSG